MILNNCDELKEKKNSAPNVYFHAHVKFYLNLTLKIRLNTVNISQTNLLYDRVK